MNQESNHNSETLPGETSENLEDSAGGGETVGSVVHTEQKLDTLSLEEVNKYLGKNFKSKDEALASVKETFNFVGKRKEDVARELESNQVTQQLSKQLEQLQVERFFDKNPDLAQFRAAFEKVGGKPDEFFNSEAFKPVFEAAKGYAEAQKVKSVLESNPRIAASQDKLSKAREAAKSGHTDAAESFAAKAVLDSLQ